MIPYRTNFLLTKYFGGTKFSADKIFGAISKFWQFCPVFHPFLISPLYKKNMFKHEFYISLSCFKFKLTKYFRGQKFSVDKIFGSKSDFWQLVLNTWWFGRSVVVRRSCRSLPLHSTCYGVHVLYTSVRCLPFLPTRRYIVNIFTPVVQHCRGYVAPSVAHVVRYLLTRCYTHNNLISVL